MLHSVQFSRSVVSDSATPWTAACQASLSITNFQSSLKLMSIESVMPSNHLILCHPLLLPPSIFPSIRIFSNESVLRIRWPIYWSFSFNISCTQYAANLENSAMAIGLEKFSFRSNPKEGQSQRMFKLPQTALISHASKVMLNILQARLQQYMNWELPDVQAGFRKGRGTRDHIANILWIIEKAREFQKNIYFCFIDYAKTFDCVDHNKLWKILKEMGIPGHLTCLLKNLYAGQEATVRTGHGTSDWFQIRRGVLQGCILSSCLFNLYAEYVMQNAKLVEAKKESRLLGEISITSDMQMTQPLWQKVKSL